MRDVVEYDTLDEVEPLVVESDDPTLRQLDGELAQARAASRIQELIDQLQARDRELVMLRKQLDSSGLHALERTAREQHRELDKMRKREAALQQQLQRITYARATECDPHRMCAHALDAFNASEHAERMLRITRTLGEPEVSVADEGPSIPRKVTLILAWDIAWYEFSIKLDLATSRASVHEVDHGGDPRKIDADRRTKNGRWQSSGVVLR